jgi:hypothetical protein
VKIVERVKAEVAGVRLEDAEIVISGAGLKALMTYAVLSRAPKSRWGSYLRAAVDEAGCRAICKLAHWQNRQPEAVCGLCHLWRRAAYGWMWLFQTIVVVNWRS